MKHYAVAELVVDGESKSLKFLRPVPFRWLADALLALYAWRKRNEGDVVTRVVDRDRAEFLFVSYTEWALRRQIDEAAATAEGV